MPIYLDNNATTFLDPAVAEVFHNASVHLFGNPSSIHYAGRAARAKLAEAREQIAAFFKVRPQEVVFNSCASEGLNALIQSVPVGGHIITSVAEHACVYESVKWMETQGRTATFLPTGLIGAVQPEAVKAAIRPDTALIVLMAVNNETGVKTDIDTIAAIAQQAKIPFVVDGVAWLGKEVFTIPAGVSAISFSGHKIHAPKGIGVTIQRAAYKPRQLLHGGGQEGGRRAGTENVPGILAFAKALSLLNATGITHMQSLRDRLEERLLKEIAGVQINGSGPRICNTSNMAFPGIEGEALLMALDLEGIAVSHGSACASGALEPSRVLLAMDILRQQAEGSVRFSVSRFNTVEEIDQAVDRIIYFTKKL